MKAKKTTPAGNPAGNKEERKAKVIEVLNKARAMELLLATNRKVLFRSK